MITGLQTFAQKHYQWLFGILLVIIIASFIFAYGPASNLSHGESPWHENKLFLGYDLQDAAVAREISRDASVGFYLKNGYPAYNQSQFKQLIFERIIALDMANKLGIPNPSTAQLGVYMATLPALQDDQGHFNRAQYDALVEQFADAGGEKFLSAAVAERWRLDQLEDVMGRGAYYLPESLKREAALRSARYTLELATLPNTLADKLSLSDEEVQKYFDAHASDYQSPQTREGIYYELSADKFIARVETPSEDVLKKYFDKISFKFLQWQKTEENGQVTGEKPQAPTYAEHAEDTLKLYKQEKASRMAAEVVDEVVGKIYADNIAPQSPAWDELTKSAGLVAIAIPASRSSDTVEGVPADAMDVLFSLGSTPYSGAFQTDDAGGFVLLTKTHEPTPMSFEQAKDAVTVAARSAKAQEAFAALANEAANELKKATSVADFEKTAADKGWTASHPEAFALASAPKELQGHIKLLQSLITAQEGAVLAAVDSQSAVAAFVLEVATPEFSLSNEDCRQAQKILDTSCGDIIKDMGLSEWGLLHSAK
jgi:hypothetical protein